MRFIGTRKFPKGPDLKRLERHKILASGTEITYLAPKHNDSGIPAYPVTPKALNLYDSTVFGRYEEKDLTEPASFGATLKHWEFTGIPLLDGTGELGEMTFEVSIENMPEFASLFRSRHLECAVERYIYAAYTSYRIPGQCRMDWKVHTINNVVWVNYHSNGYPGFRNAEECYESVWHTPITDQHLLTVRFDQVIRKKRTRLAEVYQNIINKIMSSFEIQLSSDAQSQLDAVKANFPDETLNETLPPYEFEEVDILERLDLINQVSAENNHDLSIPDDVFEAQVQKKDRDQKRKAKDIKEKILASHLRFKEMK